MYRINEPLNRVEVSVNKGATWGIRSSTSSNGKLKDLLWFHNRLFALTESGLLFSANGGGTWGYRGGGDIVRRMIAIQDDGNVLYGLTADGHLCFSNNEGATWGIRG